MRFPLWRRKQKEELDEELRGHFDAAVRERMERGQSRAEAEAAARREFGNSDLVREVTRDMWGWASLDRLSQDVRYGLRQLRLRPGLTLIAILTLALGIGANTAIFSAVSAMFLRPIPVQSPDDLVALRNQAGHRMLSTLSYPNYEDVRDQNSVFSDLMAYRFAPVAVSHEGVNQRVWCYMVTGNYFSGLGLVPHMGRLLTVQDDREPGGHPVAVLGYDSWQRRFGGRADILGQELIVNRRSYTVVGVAPKGFFGTDSIASPEIWFSASMQAELEPGLNLRVARGIAMYSVLGRMKSGVTHAQVQANLDALSGELASLFPEENKDMRIVITEPGGLFRTFTAGFALLLMAVAALVLLLACANLSNLLMARAIERHEETAIRLAMGASRGRLVRQLLTESMLLAVGGGLLGMLPALWPIRLRMQLRPPADFPIVFDAPWDYRVLAFGFLVTLLTGVAFGLLPALQATRQNIAPGLKSGRLPGRRRTWVTRSLVAAQVSLSLVLLTGAGLMVRALQQAEHLELGFVPERAVEVGFDLRMQGYTQAAGREFHRQLLERVRVIPGVQAAGLTDLVPVDLHFGPVPLFVEGMQEERAADAPRVMTSRISPGYLTAMGTRLLAGRDFEETDDDASELVAIVNLAFAERFWPGGDAIGKRFSLGDAQAPKLRIIGIAQDGKYNSLNAGPQPFAYRAAWQSYSGATGLIVRSTLDAPSVIASVRREVAQLDPTLPITAAPLADRLALALFPARVAASVLGAFALLGLTLAAIGIYGVISYAVSRRTRELGIRIAMGARRSDVLALVVGQGMRPAVVGALVGLPATYALTRLMQSFLFGLSPTDPLTYAGTAFLLAGVALLACYVPAQRATRVDPVTALRHE